jgi:hypothetical protein
MTAAAWATASTAVFGLLLWLAAIAKLTSPGDFGRTVSRVLPFRWCDRHPHLVAQSGRLVAVAELAAAPVVVFAGTAGAVLAVLLGLIFGAAVVQARRRGASCGCWGSLSPGQAGGAEVARAGVLIAMAAGALGARLDGAAGEWGPDTLVGAAALVVVLVVAGHVGARVGPAAGGPGVPARGGRRIVAFLLAGTAAGPVGGRPLWPWQNHRTLRRWRAESRVRGELERVGARPADLDWRRAIVRRSGSERRVVVVGARVRLVISEGSGLPGADIRCRATKLPSTFDETLHKSGLRG